MENNNESEENLLIQKARKSKRIKRIIAALIFFVAGTLVYFTNVFFWFLISPIFWFTGIFLVSLIISLGKISLSEEEILNIRIRNDPVSPQYLEVKKPDYNGYLILLSGSFFLLFLGYNLTINPFGSYSPSWVYYLVSDYLSKDAFGNYVMLFLFLLPLTTFGIGYYRIMKSKTSLT